MVRQDNLYIYQCPISEKQMLLVVLEKTETDWQVLRWQAVASEDMESGDLLPVWQGNVEREETP